MRTIGFIATTLLIVAFRASAVAPPPVIGTDLQQQCARHKPDASPVLVERPATAGEHLDFEQESHVLPSTDPVASPPVTVIAWRARKAGETPAQIRTAEGGRRPVFSSRGGIVEVRPPPVSWLEYLKLTAPEYARDAEWNATIFLGELQSPIGNRRIVHVHRSVAERSASSLANGFHAAVVRPGGTEVKARVKVTRAQAVNAKVKPLSSGGTVFRLFEGVRDPDDRSRFLIAYDVDGKRGEIDGWLTDDDQIILVVRTGPLSRDEGEW